MSDSFFNEPTAGSEVKTAIVSKYFGAWSKIVGKHAARRGERIAYVDLFSGPGRYADGTPSTPLLVLEAAIADPMLRSTLVALFNDANPEHAGALQQAIAELPGIETLVHAPRVRNRTVGEEITRVFETMPAMPMLSFVDPWGYKGLSLDLVRVLIRGWGSDCIFFFNYNRVSPGLSNPLVREHMEALFGPERAARLRERLDGMTPAPRELTIVEELVDALKDVGAAFVRPFTFRSASGSRTTHHLIFVSKNARGYEIMKDIMARASASTEQGVASFAFAESDLRQPTLPLVSRPLDELRDMLLVDFAGQTLSMGELYSRHHVGRPFVKANYKEALRLLEAEGRIAAEPPADGRRPGTFADRVVVTFPTETE